VLGAFSGFPAEIAALLSEHLIRFVAAFLLFVAALPFFVRRVKYRGSARPVGVMHPFAGSKLEMPKPREYPSAP
jgi:uncharacterized membrane protein YfcA